MPDSSHKKKKKTLRHKLKASKSMSKIIKSKSLLEKPPIEIFTDAFYSKINKKIEEHSFLEDRNPAPSEIRVPFSKHLREGLRANFGAVKICSADHIYDVVGDCFKDENIIRGVPRFFSNNANNKPDTKKIEEFCRDVSGKLYHVKLGDTPKKQEFRRAIKKIVSKQIKEILYGFDPKTFLRKSNKTAKRKALASENKEVKNQKMSHEQGTSALEKVKHPGEIIRKKILIAQNIGVGEAADRIGVHRTTLSFVLTKRTRLSTEMAIKLADEFKTYSAKKLLSFQIDWDIAQVKIKMASKIKPSRIPENSQV